MAVTTSADNTARVWDLSTGRSQHTSTHGQMLNHAVFNRDGTLLVTLGDDDIAKVWTVGDFAKPRCKLKREGNFILASFSRDESLLATVTHRNRSVAWASVEGYSGAVAPRSRFRSSREYNLKWLSFSGGGDWLGVVTVEGEAIVLSVPDWKEQARITIPRVRYERTR